MKNIALSLITACATIMSYGQSEIKFDKIIHVDELRVTSVTVSLSAPPPTDPDLWITNPDFVDSFMNKFANLDSLCADSSLTKTLYVQQDADSILVIENARDNYTFVKQGTTWQIQSFEIKSSNFTSPTATEALTSREVFDMLGSEIEKPVGNGQIWVSKRSPKKIRLIFSFDDDKLISVRL